MKNFLNYLKALILIIGLFMLKTSLLAQNKESFPVQLKIENGTIEGLYNTHTQLQTYFGIPFAKPPVGDLRWKAPQPVDNWKTAYTLMYGHLRSVTRLGYRF
jgi:para-nitrobenzyl esterase